MGKLWKASAAVLLALAAIPSLALAQATGTIAGTVTASESGGPLAGAQVSVQTTVRRTVTDAQGRYRISIEPGTYQVSVTTLGRQPDRRQVTVTAGATATANFSLATSAVAIEGIVVNAITGQQERIRESGTAVSHIEVGDINKGPITKMADILTARAPGVTLQGVAGTTGTSQRIRIRGANSLSLNNDPLIYIDGVLASNSKGGIGVGGQQYSRLNDINPTDIENIEVLKGPAASAIYGTAAANGVVLITTKRGRAGRTTWRVFGELGQLKDRNEYPLNYQSVALDDPSFDGKPVYDIDYPGCVARQQCGEVDTRYYTPCVNYQAAAGNCTQDITLSFSPLSDRRTSPFTTGGRDQFGLNVAGGTQAVTYYVSGEREWERGVIDWNTLGRTSLRANLNAQLRSNFDVQVNTGYVTSNLHLISGDNNVFSPIINGLLGPAQYLPGVDTLGQAGARVGSYFNYIPADMRKVVAQQAIDRFILGLNGNYRPLQWLSVNGNTGLDFFSRFDRQTIQPNELPLSSSYLKGYRDAIRSNNYQWTATASGVAKFDLRQGIVSTTTLGTSYQRQLFNQNECYGEGIPSGTSSCSATTSIFTVTESYTDNRTLGVFVREELAFNDRLFLAGSIRGDDNSGLRTGIIYYPSASLSWVVSEEPFFPQLGFLSNLRLRVAAGSSGLRPDFGNADTYYGAVPLQRAGGEVGAVTLTNTGNPNLKPERTNELEGGFDMGLLNDRLSLDFTAFSKTSHDALVSRNIAPSAGLTASSFVNLGQVKNWGTEYGLNAVVVDRRNIRFNARIAGSTLGNEVVDLGDSIAPITLNRGAQAHREGFPTGAFFAIPYTFNDANKDGVISASEVKVDSSRRLIVPHFPEPNATKQLDTLNQAYFGPALPTNTQTLSADLTLFRNITFTTLFERRAGMKQLNYSEYFRCRTANSYPYIGGCSALSNPDASLEDQARFVAATFLGGNSTPAGYIEDASFVKWREASVRLGAPESWGRRFPAIKGASLTLAGRNLKTWTDYSGLDPEINETGGGTNFTQGEFNTQPPVRYYTVRLDLSF
jgi:TonB-linked SusC/RagA family outer membrane protein